MSLGARLVWTAETSSRKGRDRIAAVAEATRGRTIHARAGRGKKTIARFAENQMDCGGDNGAIYRASIDMSPARIPGVGAYLPNADSLPQSGHLASRERRAAAESGGSERKRGRTCSFERAGN